MFEQAKDRVVHDVRLAEHQEFILADWNEGEEHWEWVCAAPVDKILDWVEHCHANFNGPPS